MSIRQQNNEYENSNDENFNDIREIPFSFGIVSKASGLSLAEVIKK